jgi:hypothetical protein
MLPLPLLLCLTAAACNLFFADACTGMPVFWCLAAFTYLPILTISLTCASFSPGPCSAPPFTVDAWPARMVAATARSVTRPTTGSPMGRAAAPTSLRYEHTA